MNCQVCGSQNETGSFCSKCGSPLVAQDQQQYYQGQQHTYQNGPTQGQYQEQQYQQQQFGNSYYGGPQGSPQPNPSEISAKAKDYLSFVTSALKKPFEFGSSVNGESWINGLITLIISSLFSSFILATFVGYIFNLFNPFALNNLYNPMATFFSGFLSSILSTAVTVGALFVVVKMINKVNVDFKSILARYGAFMVLPAGISVIIFLFVLIRLGNLAFLLFVVSLLCGFLGTILTALSYHSQAKLDKYYSLLILYAIIGVANYIVFQIT